MRKGHWQTVKSLRAQITDYPLYPYLLYADLSGNLRYARQPEIKAYLEAYEGSVKAENLRNKWLAHLAKYSYWQSYLEYYRAESASVKQQCQFQLARYNSDSKNSEQQQSALAAAVELWNVGQSQPSECDKLFNLLKSENKLTEELVWQRYNKAVLNHQTSLARYLRSQLKTERYQSLATLYGSVRSNPRIIQSMAKFSRNSPEELEIINHGLIHLAQKDSRAALTYWSHYQQTYEFSHRSRSEIVSAIIKALYQQDHDDMADSYFADQLPLLNETLDGSLVEWRIRCALAKQDWPTVQAWIERLPAHLKKQSVWRYWALRSLQSNPETTMDPRIAEITASLAKERDFYGFLASDMLDKEYSMNHRPLAIDDTQLSKIANVASIKRARELLFHGDDIDANREWASAASHFSYDDWLAAAVLSSQWRWHNKAIASLGQAKYWDDVEIRFPIKHLKTIEKNAKKRDLTAPLVLALVRQESAFNTTATSPAWAMGLMQLMPATAKQAARQHNIAYRERSQLYQPKTNIAIASAYYSDLLKRFKGNRILASAAYNAGPHRVDQWLKRSAGQLPFDVWMEIIPYNETRAYVRNILMYSVIYSRKMGTTPPMLLKDEKLRLL